MVENGYKSDGMSSFIFDRFDLIDQIRICIEAGNMTRNMTEDGDPESNEKTRQNAENKQIFDLTGKTCQNTENKQTFDLTRKL